MIGKALILGGNGRFGRHVAEAMWNSGWQVTLYERGTDLIAAAEGVDVIVNGANPPYHRWAAELPGLTDRVIAAARASGATLLQAANLYVYGKGSSELLGTETPHRARNRLGRIRIAMEERLRASGCRVILLRAGDFLDTQPSGNWFDRIIAKDMPRGRLGYPGNPDVLHDWAFLPDVARAATELAGLRDTLPDFAEIPFPGYPLTGHDMARLLAGVSGRAMALRRMPWWPLVTAQPFMPMARGLVEMRYLWNMPHRLDPAPFRAILPEFRTTSPEEALRQATAFLNEAPASPTPDDAPRRARAA